MGLKEIETYWVTTSNEDYESAVTLFEKQRYVHSMFFLHLSIEKMMKGLFVKSEMKEAPFIHNLPVIASKITMLKPDEEKTKLLADINEFNIAGRYDDYKMNFHKICDRAFAEKYLVKGNELLIWLKSLMK